MFTSCSFLVSLFLYWFGCLFIIVFLTRRFAATGEETSCLRVVIGYVPEYTFVSAGNAFSIKLDLVHNQTAWIDFSGEIWEWFTLELIAVNRIHHTKGVGIKVAILHLFDNQIKVPQFKNGGYKGLVLLRLINWLRLIDPIVLWFFVLLNQHINIIVVILPEFPRVLRLRHGDGH